MSYSQIGLKFYLNSLKPILDKGKRIFISKIEGLD